MFVSVMTFVALLSMLFVTMMFLSVVLLAMFLSVVLLAMFLGVVFLSMVMMMGVVVSVGVVAQDFSEVSEMVTDSMSSVSVMFGMMVMNLMVTSSLV